MNLSQQHNHLEYLFPFVTWNSHSTSLLPHAQVWEQLPRFSRAAFARVSASQGPRGSWGDCTARRVCSFEVLVSCPTSKGLPTGGFAFVCLSSSIFKTCHFQCSTNKIPFWLTSSYINLYLQSYINAVLINWFSCLA